MGMENWQKHKSTNRKLSVGVAQYVSLLTGFYIYLFICHDCPFGIQFKKMIQVHQNLGLIFQEHCYDTVRWAKKYEGLDFLTQVTNEQTVKPDYLNQFILW